MQAAHTTLMHAAQRGGLHIAAVAESLADNGLFTHGELTRYLGALDYSLGERQLAGIRHFAKLAARRGDVDEDADITFFGGDA